MDEKVARQIAKIRLTGALTRIEGSASGARLALGMVQEIDWEGVEVVLQEIERDVAAMRKAAGNGRSAAPVTARLPMEHDLKCHPGSFNAVVSGRKPFEWRKFDRDYQVGDILCLRDWDPERQQYTGAVTRQRVTCLISGCFGIPADYCIMGIEFAGRAPSVETLEAAPEAERRKV